MARARIPNGGFDFPMSTGMSAGDRNGFAPARRVVRPFTAIALEEVRPVKPKSLITIDLMCGHKLHFERKYTPKEAVLYCPPCEIMQHRVVRKRSNC